MLDKLGAKVTAGGASEQRNMAKEGLVEKFKS